jgi:hypothetical protein
MFSNVKQLRFTVIIPLKIVTELLTGTNRFARSEHLDSGENRSFIKGVDVSWHSENEIK